MELDDFSLEPLEKELLVDSVETNASVSLVRSDNSYSGFVPLTPSAVKTLTDQGVKVFVEFGFAAGSPYADAEYAEAGAEFVEKFADLAILGKVIVKYNGFTMEQVMTIPKDKVVFTVMRPENLSVGYVDALNSRNITSFSAELIKGERGEAVLGKIGEESLSPIGHCVALSSFLLPLVETLLFTPTIAYAIQRNPLITQGVYTHLGWLCSREIADELGIRWRDLLSLCWDLN